MIFVNARFLTQDLTGVQRFAEQISMALQTLRNDVVFVSPGDIKNKKVADLLNVKVVGKNSGHHWEQRDLPAFLKRNDNPLLVNLGNTAPLWYKNKIVTHHDVTYKKFPESYSRKFRLMYNLLIPVMLRNSRALLTVSEFSKKEITAAYRYNPEKTFVIYNAVSDIFKPASTNIKSDEEKFLLAVSSPNYHKNFHGLLAAFSSVSKHSNVKLKIIGGANKNFAGMSFSGKDENDMKNVEFLGRVTDDELVSIYQKALAFVFPSFYEGFGIPPLEAQACGCPVVSSNQASLPEVLADSAMYFDPYNNQDMVNALENIIQNGEMREELKNKGYKNILNYSWVESARKLDGIINKL
ncbi:glycosyltransferase family 4 protein [Serratia marcescens]|uniref:glycosyltransferase family 4 protein n=1 Tax=Serratia marcescens TaxID=615 RepID=UPI002DB5B78F|nr:glycosyltransferase family 1 protein [Serratia marcescens]MEB6082078.1 glycosyltransferase family 4 protein [Serratia marcescens]